MTHNEEMYIYKSTCLFDTILELSGSAYCNYVKYQKAINDSCRNKTCFGDVMAQYMLTGNEEELYKNRLEFCLKYFNVENNKIYYRYRIGHLVSQIYRDCTKNVFYLKLQPKSNTEMMNIKQLSCYINECIHDTTEIAKYLYVDVSDYYENFKCDLQDVPVQMVITKKNFALAGAIEYEHSKYDLNFIHYTTFCRTLSNYWCLKDDLAKKIKYLKNSSIKVAILM